MKNASVLKSSFVALFSAIICVSGLIKIPLGIIPVVFQNAMCILTSTLLGGILGALPTALFLALGVLGFPVYSGGTSGIAVWAGPTGGFLPGYLIGALFASLISGVPSVKEKNLCFKTVFRISFAIIFGMFILYVPGILHFMNWLISNNQTLNVKDAFTETFAVCVIPSIPGDIVKTVLAIFVSIKIRPIFAQYIKGSL